MLGNEIIYQIFVRNYSQEGTFQAVEKDLPRIKDLGVGIIYLLPIHEIGVLNRKGTLGSPYAIKDYFSINKEYGTKEDLISLINSTHKLGMKIILDMVFNHTSPDNVLVDTHPEYYFYKNGKRGNRVGDWSDIVDLDTSRDDTQEYLLSVLKYWVSLGIDGFRFDVASMIPLSFFKKARKELGKDLIFIGESIDPGFANYLKEQGDNPTDDKDMYPTFDSLYNYSWYRDFINFIKGDGNLKTLVKSLNDTVGLRLNCMENHDTLRIRDIAKHRNFKEILNFYAYIKGQLFIYNGQEYGNTHRPDLFEKDPIIWEKDEKYLSMYKSLIAAKKEQAIDEDIVERFSLINSTTIEVAKYKNDLLIDKQQFDFGIHK